jgi:HAD superfamily hydrolase (TIGR01549 family)
LVKQEISGGGFLFMSIKAVTFDLWDTLVDDDSDEPKRADKGLLGKKEERRRLMFEALHSVAPIGRKSVDLAYDVADAGFDMTWRENHINWTIEQRMRVILNGLGRTLPDDVMAKLVANTGQMEVDIPPNLIDGIDQALATLSKRYKLCIVSDAIVTPGTGLRKILNNYNLGKYFQGYAFSDEVGHAKPHRSMFDSAAQQLQIEVTEIVHIGDRDYNDIKGPQAIGAKAVLFTATRDDDKDITTADAICERAADLPTIIDQLASA